jgi:hypothetical protein
MTGTARRAALPRMNIAGGIPPAFRNHLVPTGCDTPASSAASSLLSPAAIPRQNLLCSSRPATCGRPGDGNGARPDRADRRLRMLIATSNFRALRRPLESALLLLSHQRPSGKSSRFPLSSITFGPTERTDAARERRQRCPWPANGRELRCCACPWHYQRPHGVGTIAVSAPHRHPRSRAGRPG